MLAERAHKDEEMMANLLHPLYSASPPLSGSEEGVPSGRADLSSGSAGREPEGAPRGDLV